MDQLVNLAADICNGNKVERKYDLIYPFSTENMEAYMNLFDFNGKSLLTVGSSGDQIFNAILYGCKDITLVDICPFSKYYIYLKAAAIKSMGRKEFLNFFCYRGHILKNNMAFMDNKFYVLLDCLDDINREASQFWTSLFRKYKGIQIRKNLFTVDEFSSRVLIAGNKYLSNDYEYLKLRNKINEIYNVKYITKDIFNYDSFKKYDNINLSNIGAFYNISEFTKLVYKFDNYLNDDGLMMMAYLFDTDLICKFRKNSIYNTEELLKKSLTGTQITSFIGSNGVDARSDKFHDSVVTYKKIKKM